MDYNQLKNFDGLQTRINIALINWDPLDIQKTGDFAHNVYLEYARYVDDIVRVIDNKKNLKELIWKIAKDFTGLDESNDKLSIEVNDLVNTLSRIKEEFDFYEKFSK